MGLQKQDQTWFSNVKEHLMDSYLLVDISKDQLRSMADFVEKALFNSLKALLTSETLLARDVIDNDKVVNSYEIDIDNSTYKIFSIDPMPSDAVRMIMSIQKINAMLERIGDHAVNIAESAISLIKGPKDVELFNVPKMADLSKIILHDALTSFFEKKSELAEEVLTRDDAIDELNIKISDTVKEKVHSGAMSFETAMEIIRICKNLERVADLSTNIAEETCFSMAGKIIKHHENIEI
jgi:phosphate transport system protein